MACLGAALAFDLYAGTHCDASTVPPDEGDGLVYCGTAAIRSRTNPMSPWVLRLATRHADNPSGLPVISACRALPDPDQLLIISADRSGAQAVTPVQHASRSFTAQGGLARRRRRLLGGLPLQLTRPTDYNSILLALTASASMYTSLPMSRNFFAISAMPACATSALASTAARSFSVAA
jgi:hypothetical protein